MEGHKVLGDEALAEEVYLEPSASDVITDAIDLKEVIEIIEESEYTLEDIIAAKVQQGDSEGELVEVENVIKSNFTSNLLNCKNDASKAQTNVSSTKFTIKNHVQILY